MRIVITGATGNIGTAVLRRLAREDHELVGLARRVPGGTDARKGREVGALLVGTRPAAARRAIVPAAALLPPVFGAAVDALARPVDPPASRLRDHAPSASEDRRTR